MVYTKQLHNDVMMMYCKDKIHIEPPKTIVSYDQLVTKSGKSLGNSHDIHLDACDLHFKILHVTYI